MNEARRMPDQVAEVFDPLCSEIHLLHGRWTIYRQLFAESQKRYDLLNKCASGFFGVIHGVLYDDVLLSLCKLGDPAKSMRKDSNFSLWQVQDRLTELNATLASRTRPLLETYKLTYKDFKRWRDKRISHLDLIVALQTHVDALPGISRDMVEQALAVVREFMNTIDAHYTGTTQGYEHFWHLGDGEALIAVLKHGLRYDELLKDKVIEHGDWRRSKWHDS